MAAPSGTVWGSVVGSYGRIGIYVDLKSTNTTVERDVQIWFWSKYSVSDTSNTLYYDCGQDVTSAKTSKGSVSVSTTVETGEGWSTSNQKKIKSYTTTHTKGTGSVTYKIYVKLTDIDRVGGTMYVNTTYTIPALAKYTISYDANGGSGAPNDQTKYYGKNISVSNTKPTRTGYTFLGWSVPKRGYDEAYYSPGETIEYNGNQTLVAVWRANKLTVKYHINGGTLDSDTYYASSSLVYLKSSSSVLTQSRTYNNSFAPDGLYNASTFGLSRTGYNFKGWKVGSSGTTVFDQDDATVKPTDLTSSIKTGDSTVTMYAVWELKTYTVSYNANGGSGAPSNDTKKYGQTLTLSSTKPTRSGYTFMGWGTSASDTSADYSAGGNYTANSAITLYAVWKKTITLSYNANGGSGAPSSSSADIYNSTTSKAFTISSVKPTRTGYTFLGWSTSNSATTATYSAGDSITLSGSTTLYAVWQINSYKLTVKPNGGTWNGKTAESSFTQNYATKKTIANPTWAGHTFSGWTLSGSGTLSGTTYTFGAGAGILTARWDANDYVVTFDAGTNGGVVNGLSQSQKAIEYGTKIGTLPTAEKTHYSFLGWYTSANGGTKITSDYIVTGNITLYAQYEIDASAYVNEESVWEEGVTYVTDKNGNVKKGHAKVNVNGVWKDGYCK